MHVTSNYRSIEVQISEAILNRFDDDYQVDLNFLQNFEGPSLLNKILAGDFNLFRKLSMKQECVDNTKDMFEYFFEEVLKGFFDSFFEGFFDNVISFLIPQPGMDCHIIALSNTLKKYGMKMSIYFATRYPLGILKEDFINFCFILGQPLTWRSKKVIWNPLYSLGNGDRIYVSGDSITNFRPPKLEWADNILHYVSSDNRIVESINVALVVVINKRISNKIEYKRDLTRNGATNREWETAQTLFVKVYKKAGLKHKNLHTSKRNNILAEVEKMIEEVGILCNEFTKDNTAYIPCKDTYRLKTEKIIHQKKEKIKKTVFSKGYTELVPIKTYRSYTVDTKKLEEFIQKQVVFYDYRKRFKKHLEKLIQEYTDDQEFIPYDIHEGCERVVERYNRILTKDVFESLIKKDTVGYDKKLQNIDPDDREEVEKYLRKKYKSYKKYDIERKIRVYYEEVFGEQQEYKEVKHSPERTIVEEEIIKEVVEIRKTKIPIAIMSEEEHRDFISVSMDPDPKILMRAKKRFLYNTYKRIKGIEGDRIKKDLLKCRKISRRFRRKRGWKNDFFTDEKDPECQTLLEDKRQQEEILDLHYQKYKLNDMISIKKEVDYNVYDFEYIQKLKMMILATGIFWSTGYCRYKEYRLNDLNRFGRLKGSRKYLNSKKKILYLDCSNM